MSGNLKEGIDRRDFIIASIATVGAANVLVASAGVGHAQDNATANSAAQGTVYTGDVVQGKKVVSALDVNDLAPGQKHQLYFLGVQKPTAQDCFSPQTTNRRGSVTHGE